MNFGTRQHKILQISLEIISEEGVQNFTMRQIAQKLGTSEPAIYRHFPNKTAILEALLEQLSSQHKVAAKKFLNGRDFTGIAGFFKNVLSVLAEKPALSAVIFSEEIFQNEPVLREKVASIMKKTESAVIVHLKHFPSLCLPSVKHTAWLFLGSVRFLVTRWRVSGFSFDLKNEGAVFIDELTCLHTDREEK